jgi:hypothetical protein
VTPNSEVLWLVIYLVPTVLGALLLLSVAGWVLTRPERRAHRKEQRDRDRESRHHRRSRRRSRLPSGSEGPRRGSDTLLRRP